MLSRFDWYRRVGLCAALGAAGVIGATALGAASVEYQKLLAGDGETPDQFGTSLDTLGERMLVGAKYGNFDLILDCGAVYVWKRVGPTSWEEEAKLNAPDADPNDVFGISCALGDDVALVGAYFDDVVTANNDNSGSVYAFTRAMDGTWGFHQKFMAPGIVGGELFGISMAMDGDAAIIGASAEFDAGIAGAAHIYRRNMAGDWVHEQALSATDAQVNDSFGLRVDIEGDTAIAGASGNDGSLGAAYVFTRDAMTGVWGSGVKLTPANRIAGERFGWSVSVSGDAVLIGATQEGTPQTGAAYVFRSDGLGGWVEEDRFVGAEAEPRDQFGRSVKLSGDFAIVGATENGFFPTPGDKGSVYVFRHSGGNWSQVERILASDGENNDQFGNAVALDQGLLLVGAVTENEFGPNAGAAYVFDTHEVLCAADLNGDFVIDTADLGLLIGGFGGSNPSLDINGDGIVDTADLGLLIGSFGAGCE